MPDQGVFENNDGAQVTNSDVPVTQTVATDAFADQLGVIKNADGTPKYASVDKALEALVASQTHIAKLEGEAVASSTELTNLREQVAKSETVDEVIARLTASQDQQVQDTPQPKVDEADIVKLVQSALTAERTASTKEDNLNLVQKALVEKYGEKAADVVEAKANELGITKEALKEMASSNPRVALALFTQPGGSPSDSPTSTSIHLPTQIKGDDPIEKPEKSLLMGATSKEQAAFMERIKEAVHKRHNVET